MEEFTLGVISSILISFKALFRILPAPKILAHYYTIKHKLHFYHAHSTPRAHRCCQCPVCKHDMDIRILDLHSGNLVGRLQQRSSGH